MPPRLTNPYPVINGSITLYPEASTFLALLRRELGLSSRALIGLLLEYTAARCQLSDIVAFIHQQEVVDD